MRVSSWIPSLVISSVIRRKTTVYSFVAITYIWGLLPLLIPTHEPPSTRIPEFGFARHLLGMSVSGEGVAYFWVFGGSRLRKTMPENH